MSNKLKDTLYNASIQKKMIFFLLLVLILLLTSSMFITMNTINRLENEIIRNRLLDEKNILTNQFANWEKELIRTGIIIQENHTFQELLLDPDREEISPFVTEFKTDYQLDYMSVIDSRQMDLILPNTNQITQLQHNRSLLAESLKGSSKTAILWSSDGWMMVNSFPLNNYAVLIGKLFNDAAVQELNFQRRNPTLLIYRQDGLPINGAGDNVDKLLFNAQEPLQEGLWEAVLEGQFVIESKNSLFNNDEIGKITGYGPIIANNIPTTVYAIQISTAEISTLRQEMVVQLWLFSILLGSIAIFALFLFLRSYLLTPINNLTAAAESVSQGNLDIQLPNLTSQDEIGTLSRNFNHMVGEIKRTRNSLQKQNELVEKQSAALSDQNKELEQFAYITSHDLKAPLRSIRNLTTWIEEDLQGKLDEDTQDYMDKLQGRVGRMEALIDGLLQYSRVGRKKEDLVELNVHQLLVNLLDLLAPPETYQFIIQPDMPTLVTEHLKLQQVFANLLSNAVKYHDRPDGKIEISYQDLDENNYQFTVADDGPGIDPAYHEKIFAIFQTLQARDSYESTGIGLAIVQKIIQDRNGRIWVESAVGQGSKFHFSWPKQINLEQSEPLA